MTHLIKLVGVFTFVAAISARSEGLQILSADVTDETLVSVNETDDRYQKLIDLYNSVGTLPDENLNGMFSGRCFEFKDRQTATNHLLIAGEVLVGGDGGPEFPPVISKRFVAVDYDGREANYFDELSRDELNEIQTQVPGFLKSVVETSEKDGYLYTKAISGGDLEFRLRRWNDKHILLGVLTKDYDGQKAGDIFSACYSFKKID